MHLSKSLWSKVYTHTLFFPFYTKHLEKDYLDLNLCSNLRLLIYPNNQSLCMSSLHPINRESSCVYLNLLYVRLTCDTW